jgi:hypothetical protein
MHGQISIALLLYNILQGLLHIKNLVVSIVSFVYFVSFVGHNVFFVTFVG